MSDPKVKPSIAARELAEKLLDQMPVMFRVQRKERVAGLIQAALGELLEKAEDCANAGRHGLPESQHELIEAMKPWKTTI